MMQVTIVLLVTIKLNHAVLTKLKRTAPGMDDVPCWLFYVIMSWQALLQNYLTCRLDKLIIYQLANCNCPYS